MIDTINANWSPKMREQQPIEIGFKNSMISAADRYLYSRTLNNTVWSSPLYYGIIYPDWQHYLIVNASSPALQRVSVYRPTGTAPVGGWLYATDQNQTYYNTIQQGRFLQFGFYGLPDRTLYAWPWFVNLVKRTDETNYP